MTFSDMIIFKSNVPAKYTSNTQLRSADGRGHSGHQLMMLLCLLCLWLAGCVKNQFEVSFSLPESVNSTYKLSYYASDPRGGLQVETAIAVAAGKGMATGITRFPTLVTISRGNADIPAAIFYAERGDKIKISGEGADPVDWKIEGNKTTASLSEWRLANKDLITAAISASGDSASLRARRKLNAAVAAFVKSDPSQRAAALTLWSYYDAAIDPAAFASLQGMLEENGATADIAMLLARDDTQSANPPLTDPAKHPVKSLILQSRDNNIDTLHLGKSGHPAIIYYWHKEAPDYKTTLDTLRRLAAWRPDSASMAIADVCLTPDSALWRNTLRNDSLRHIVRAFAAQGLADKDVMNLGVRRTPWFIVLSPQGTIKYSGSDMAKSAAAFRKLRPKKK